MSHNIDPPFVSPNQLLLELAKEGIIRNDIRIGSIKHFIRVLEAACAIMVRKNKFEKLHQIELMREICRHLNHPKYHSNLEGT